MLKCKNIKLIFIKCLASLSEGEGLRVRPFIFFFLFSSCSVSHQLSKYAQQAILKDSALLPAHAGISIYEPSTGKYWYNYQANKYFVPASNTKLFSLYAGLKYLGDSLVGIKYVDTKDTLFLLSTGDPTFLNAEFKDQTVFNFLKRIKKPVVIINNNWKENALGFGWSWDDYESDDMTERSSFPIYANIIKWTQVREKNNDNNTEGILVYSEPDINWKAKFIEDSTSKAFNVGRERNENIYEITFGTEKKKEIKIPFVTNGIESAIALLKDTLGLNISTSTSIINKNFSVIHSQATDSLFKIMMHRSDNFFAEQTLLMTSNEKLGYMSDAKIIDTLLKTDLKDIPQKPKWVDGSGLSRYNLFTPQDFVYILNKMKNEFGLERLKVILPTGGTGTLRSYYKQDSGFIFAKTGSLSNHIALSGFLITKANKLLIFSILIDNFISPATAIRKAAEKFLTYIRQHS